MGDEDPTLYFLLSDGQNSLSEGLSMLHGVQVGILALCCRHCILATLRLKFHNFLEYLPGP